MSEPSTYDFFISYTAKDEAWAEWIAWHLKQQGYTLRFQKWHFNAGNSWVAEMQRALQQCQRMIAVLSPDYLKSEHGQAEWNVFYAKDPDGSKALLIPIRIAKTDLNDLHKTRNYIDFIGNNEVACLDALISGLKPVEPAEKPAFPPLASSPAPSFPPTRPPSTSIPNNLPRLQTFFGREEELAKIADALDPENRSWGALIDGPGGMGKTSLAIRAALDCSPEQFGRIVFVSIKDRELDDDGVRSLGNFLIPGFLEMLNELARELGCPEITKSPENERVRLLLDALRPARTLLILDNLESLTKQDRDQLLTFVKRLPQGCKAILTSRRRIGSGSEELILEKLSQQAALDTLADLAKHNPLLERTSEAERIALYEQTTGKPLLLRWVAGQIGRGRCRTFNDALAFLRSCPPDNDPLEFIFGDLIEDFSAEETKVLSALTYFTQPARVKHIAGILSVGRTGFSEEEIKSSLASLSNRSLVIPDLEEREFSLVPMVAEFLRKHRSEIVRETKNQLERRAVCLIEDNGYENHDRFPTLRAEWTVIEPALPLLLEQDNQKVQKLCKGLQTFLNYAGYWDEWLALCDKAETKAVAEGDYKSACWRAYDMGWTCSLREEGDHVLYHASRAAMHLEKTEVTPREKAAIIGLRSTGFRLTKDYEAAIAASSEAIALFRACSEAGSEDEVTALNDLANAEYESEKLQNAKEHYREALAMALTGGFDECSAIILGNLADVELRQRNWAIAEEVMRRVLPLSESIYRMDMVAGNLHRLSYALMRQNKVLEAMPFARRSLEISVSLDLQKSIDAAQATLSECRLLLALQKLDYGWTYNTTTLEGNTLTLSEVEQALSDPAAIIANRPAEHVAATRAQGEALKLLAEYLQAGRDWTSDDLFRLHTVLMQGSTVDSFKPIGAWKIEDNGTSIKLDGKLVWNDAYATARNVSALMETWLAELNRRRKGDLDPMEDHIWLHAAFVRIHPFADGNGRMARLLANLPLLAAGLDPVNIPATARDRYLESLARWQIACGPPKPHAPLCEKDELLADFKELCRSSIPESGNPTP